MGQRMVGHFALVHYTAGELFVTLEKYCFPVEVQAAKSPEAYSNTDSLAAKEEVLAAIGNAFPAFFESFQTRPRKTNIAEQLTEEFIDYSGGSKAASNSMLPLLEKLAMVEETVIRQAAVTSMNRVFAKLKVDEVRTHGMGILTRLAEADWFTSRVSASALTPKLYQLLNFEAVRCVFPPFSTFFAFSRPCFYREFALFFSSIV